MWPTGGIALRGCLPFCERYYGPNWICGDYSIAMGQPRVSSVTWRNRIKRISQGFYETVGQQIHLATKAKTALALNHRKKSKSCFTFPCNICRGFESFSSNFPAYGMAVYLKQIRENEPLCPSAKLKRLGEKELLNVANCRRIEPSDLDRILSGDLDRIVMKCLEKDRE